MKKTVFSAKVYDYTNPVFGNLNVLSQISSKGDYLYSNTYIVNEIKNKDLFRKIIESSKDEIYLDKMSGEILSIASLDKKLQNNKEINLGWIETQRRARGKGLATLVLAAGVSQVNLADDAILHAVFDDEGSEWSQRANFYDTLGFNNVPKEKCYDCPESLAMTVETAKFKRINLEMLKPNKQLTECMMEYSKSF